MAKLYCEAVKNGSRTLDSVPKRWRDAVASLLDQDKSDAKEVTE